MQTRPLAQDAIEVRALPDARDHREVFTFTELGAHEALRLLGVDDSASVSFGVRGDEVVVGAKLRLRVTHSPAMLPELSHLRVVLNNEVVGTLALPREQAGREQVHELAIEPSLFTDFNRLSIQQVGHYSLDCEDAMHTSLWSAVSSRSELELVLRPLNLQGGLVTFPAPFFDRRDGRRLELPVAFAAQPTLPLLRAAGVLASWFGAQAGYRSARFPVLIGTTPARHAVVLATNAARPGWLSLPEVAQPTIAVLDHPSDPYVKLLVLQGRDEAQVQAAVDALVLGQAAMTGRHATVSSVNYPPARKPYDAPTWVRTDRPARFDELVGSLAELQSEGHTPPPIRVNLRLPPDLLTWSERGVSIDLRYRYTPPVARDNSTLTVAINDRFVQAFRLNPEGESGTESRLTLPLFGTERLLARDPLVIPAFQIGANNQLQFQFTLDYHNVERCRDTAMDAVLSAIDPDSTVDLTPFPHYTAMPNLTLFANGGFPFTKYADLAQTLVTLPKDASVPELEAFLFTLGRMGRMTGVAALQVKLAQNGDEAALADRDVLVIGAARAGDLLAKWGKSLPALVEQQQRHVKTSDRGLLSAPLLGLDEDEAPAQAASVTLAADGALGALLGFESPVTDYRTVIALTGTGLEGLERALTALEDEGLVQEVHGDVTFVRGRTLSSFQVAEPYYVGEIGLVTRIWYHLSQHPVVLALIGLAAAVLLAILLYWTLKRVAARRMTQ